MEYMSLASAPLSHPYVACGDLQEDLWLGVFSEGEREEEGESQICVINFKGKASYFTEVREQRRRRRRRRREEEEEEEEEEDKGGGEE